MHSHIQRVFPPANLPRLEYHRPESNKDDRSGDSAEAPMSLAKKSVSLESRIKAENEKDDHSESGHQAAPTGTLKSSSLESLTKPSSASLNTRSGASSDEDTKSSHDSKVERPANRAHTSFHYGSVFDQENRQLLPLWTSAVEPESVSVANIKALHQRILVFEKDHKLERLDDEEALATGGPIRPHNSFWLTVACETAERKRKFLLELKGYAPILAAAKEHEFFVYLGKGGRMQRGVNLRLKLARLPSQPRVILKSDIMGNRTWFGHRPVRDNPPKRP